MNGLSPQDPWTSPPRGQAGSREWADAAPVPRRPAPGPSRLEVVAVPGFAAGALAMALFHEGILALLHRQAGVGLLPAALSGDLPAAYQMHRVSPMGLPQFVFQLLWGGAWGLLLGAAHCKADRRPSLLAGTLYGVVVVGGASLALLAQVADAALPSPGQGHPWIRTLALDGAWGWGTAAMLALLPRRAALPQPPPRPPSSGGRTGRRGERSIV